MEGDLASLTPYTISNDRMVLYRMVRTSPAPADFYYEIWTSDGTAAGTTKFDVQVSGDIDLLRDVESTLLLEPGGYRTATSRG